MHEQLVVLVSDWRTKKRTPPYHGIPTCTTVSGAVFCKIPALFSWQELASSVMRRHLLFSWLHIWHGSPWTASWQSRVQKLLTLCQRISGVLLEKLQPVTSRRRCHGFSHFPANTANGSCLSNILICTQYGELARPRSECRLCLQTRDSETQLLKGSSCH